MDGHELRMQIGQSLQKHLDLFDDETVELLEALNEPVGNLLRWLEARDVSREDRAQFLVGLAIAVALNQ